VSEPAEVSAPFETYPDRFAQLPALILGWKAPARRTPDAYAMMLASELLLEGESSRLYQKLVKGDESVVAVQGGIGERRGPSSLYLFAIPKPGRSTEEIRRTINEEIARLASEGPSAEEMEKLRNTLLNDSVRGRQTTMYRAQRLAEYTLYDGDPHLINTEVERYLAVTADEIRDVTARYLHTDNHALVEIIPSPEGAEQAEPAADPADPKQEEAEQPGAPPPQVPPHPPTPEPAPPTETPETPIAKATSDK
jgi:zinc protease